MRFKFPLYLSKIQFLVVILAIGALLFSIIAWLLFFKKSSTAEMRDQAKIAITSLPTLAIVYPGSKEFAAVDKIATPVMEIDITNCQATPQIIKIAPYFDVLVRNNDVVERTISFSLSSGTKSFTVPGGSSTKIPTIFYTSLPLPLAQGFSCDNSTSPVGAIVISAPERTDSRVKDDNPPKNE